MNLCHNQLLQSGGSTQAVAESSRGSCLAWMDPGQCPLKWLLSWLQGLQGGGQGMAAASVGPMRITVKVRG